MNNTNKGVLAFSAICGADRAVVGGKAANLASMYQEGFDVPDGFCICTSVYAQQADMGAFLTALASLPVEAAEARQAVALRIRRYLETVVIDAVVLKRIVQAYRRLCGPSAVAVAVRSSSTAEDLADASFAGQYDSFLHVCGEDAVVDAIRRCWASLWTDRAIAYREAQGMGHDDVRIAVVVQRMVDSRYAGVLFTANPLTGHRREMVIEAVAGLGEALVSGHVTPAHYRLGASGEVLEAQGEFGATVLSRLYEMGVMLQRYFGVPQDIEWAMDGVGKLWITQSRAVTTLFPAPLREDELRAYWSVNVYQGLSQPFTPLGSLMIRQRQAGMQQYMQRIGFSTHIVDVDGWLYWDITAGVCDASKRHRMAAFVNHFDAACGEVIAGLGDDMRFVQQVPSEAVPPGIQVRRWDKVIGALLFPRLARWGMRRAEERYVRQFAGPAVASADERLSFVEAVYKAACLLESKIPRMANSTGHFAQQWAIQLLGTLATSTDINAVYRGVPYNPTTEMDLFLWQVAVDVSRERTARAQLLGDSVENLTAAYRRGTLARVLQGGMSRFLELYGCRATGEIDFGVPRWSDEPGTVFTTMRSYVAAFEAGSDARANFEQARREAEEHIRQLLRRFPRRQLLWRWLTGFLLRRSRALRGLREEPKLYLMRGFYLLRVQLLEVGAALVAADKLDAPDDVMFLSLGELRAALEDWDCRPVVAKRRVIYKQESKRAHVPAVVLSDGSVPPAAVGGSVEEAGMLYGLGGAAGVVSGRAKVILNPVHASIAPGEILVCPSTDPGWTPLFLNAGALVTETGGMTSHGTTVAREYGIPAVVGVKGATTMIRDGDAITVDGSAGIIYTAASAVAISGAPITAGV